MNDVILKTKRSLPDAIPAFEGSPNFEVVSANSAFNGYALLTTQYILKVTPEVTDVHAALKKIEAGVFAGYEDPAEVRVIGYSHFWVLYEIAEDSMYSLALAVVYKGVPSNQGGPAKPHATEDEAAITKLTLPVFSPLTITAAFNNAVAIFRRALVLDIRMSAALFAHINVGPTNVFDGMWTAYHANTETGLQGSLKINGAQILVYTDTFKTEGDQTKLDDNVFLIVGVGEVLRATIAPSRLHDDS